MMMTNLDDVLVDDIKSIGLNLNDRSEKLYQEKFQDRLWIFPLLARYFKVPCHWRVPGPNKNLEKTQKSTHVLHQAEVSDACKIHDSKENRRFRIRLEDFRKKVIPDNETNTVDIRVCRR